MIEDYYTSGWEIQRLSTTNDEGVSSEGWTSVTSVEGRMRPLSGGEILQNERLNYVTTHRFYCSVIGLQSDDRIVNTNTGKIYEVKLVRNPMEMDDHLEVDCEYQENTQS